MRVTAVPFSSVNQLRAIEGMIEGKPDDLSLRFARACCLDDLGRPDDAVAAYQAVLDRDPRHFGALTNLGSLMFERGHLERAWVCFQTALAVDPNDVMAHLNVAGYYSERGAYEIARSHYEFVIAHRPGDLHANLHANNGLSILYERQGDREKAALHRDRAFERPVVWAFPFMGVGEPVRVLLLASARGGDVISNLFFDDLVMQRTVMVPEAYRAGVVLPPHHVIFNGLGEPDKTHDTLQRAIALVEASRAPVINHPRAVLRTDREQMMERLQGIPGVIAPRTRRYRRDEITPARLEADGFAFPLLLRSAGFHAGAHFELAGFPRDLVTTLAALPGDDLYAIAFTDARGDDGWVRKFRVTFIDGQPYPIHLALARQWKVHYFSADMTDRAEHRDEERRFLDDMESVIGAAGMESLRAIMRVLDLDYGGVDFGIAPDGRLIVFETNATMAIYPPGDDARWDYRRPAFERAIGAVRAMIAKRAA